MKCKRCGEECNPSECEDVLGYSRAMVQEEARANKAAAEVTKLKARIKELETEIAKMTADLADAMKEAPDD